MNASAPIVEQIILRDIIALRNAELNLRREADRVKALVLQQLLDGAEVEAGIHMAEVEERMTGGRLVKRLMVR